MDSNNIKDRPNPFLLNSNKNVLDINALKEKMAATKKKLASLRGENENKQSEVEPIENKLQSNNLTIIEPKSEEKNHPFTLSANVRYHEEEKERLKQKNTKLNQLEQKKKEFKPKDVYFDKRIKMSHNERPKKALVFLEPGELSKRSMEYEEKIKQLINENEKKNQKLDPNASVRKKYSLSSIPEIEWWDEPFTRASVATIEFGPDGRPIKKPVIQAIQNEINQPPVIKEKITWPELLQVINFQLINNLIHHPILASPPCEPPPPPPQPLMLTKEEQKKIRRQRRKIMIEERREEVLVGLRPAEKGRVRIANMMKVYGEAITDPTIIEKKVRDEMAARIARHNARNQERKLNPEQRKLKEKNKLIEDTSLSSKVAVFKIWTLINSKIRFKVDIEANKNLLTGRILLSSEFVLVIVEGGPKSIIRYKKILLNRIHWKDPPPPPKVQIKPEIETESNKETKTQNYIFGKDIAPEENECYLVWEGDVKSRTWQNFRFESSTNRPPRETLDSIGVAHYWDSAKNFVPPLQIKDEDS